MRPWPFPRALADLLAGWGAAFPCPSGRLTTLRLPGLRALALSALWQKPSPPPSTGSATTPPWPSPCCRASGSATGAKTGEGCRARGAGGLSRPGQNGGKASAVRPELQPHLPAILIPGTDPYDAALCALMALQYAAEGPSPRCLLWWTCRRRWHRTRLGLPLRPGIETPKHRAPLTTAGDSLQSRHW